MADIEPIGLELQTDGIERGIKKLDELSKQGPRVESAMAGISTESKRVAKSLADLGIGAGDGLKRTGDAAKQAATGINASGKAAREAVTDTESLRRSVSALTQSEEKFLRSMVDQANALTMNKGEMAAYTAATRGMSAGVQETARALGMKIDALKAEHDALAKTQGALVGFRSAAGLAAQALAAVGITASIGEFLRMADAVTNVNSRLKLVTSTNAELYTAQSELYKIAQNSRVGFTGLADTYAQMARSTRELGVSQKDMLAITQTISQAVTVSGGSAASAGAALVQLSQGFASGTLRGEELNSVMEQTPRLAQAIAQGMGVTIGQLRHLGSEGSLTAEKVVDALKKAALSVQNDFDQMTMTVEQASTKAANSLTRLVGVLDSITGASSSAAAGIARISTGMDTLSSSIEGMKNSNSLGDFFLAAFQKNSSLNDELQRSERELASLSKRLATAPDESPRVLRRLQLLRR